MNMIRQISRWNVNVSDWQQAGKSDWLDSGAGWGCTHLWWCIGNQGTHSETHARTCQHVTPARPCAVYCQLANKLVSTHSACVSEEPCDVAGSATNCKILFEGAIIRYMLEALSPYHWKSADYNENMYRDSLVCMLNEKNNNLWFNVFLTFYRENNCI